MFDDVRLCSRKRKEEGEENAAFCVLDGTVVRSVNYFPYKGFILNSSYLINDSSSYQVHNNMYELLVLELD